MSMHDDVCIVCVVMQGASWGQNGYGFIQMTTDSRGVCNMYAHVMRARPSFNLFLADNNPAPVPSPSPSPPPPNAPRSSSPPPPRPRRFRRRPPPARG